MNWDYYKDDELYSEILVYWYDEWLSISSDIKRGSIGVDILNIRSILSDIINEYELNEFKSDNNRKIYIKLINNVMKEDYLKEYRIHLKILIDKIEKKDYEEAYIITKEIYNKLIDENLNQSLFEGIIVLLKNKSSTKENRLNISKITKKLIIDLISMGINIADIESILRDTFANYIISNEKFDFSQEEHVSVAKKYNDSLTILDRLDVLQKKLSPEAIEYSFVFPIWGGFSNLLEKLSIIDGYLYNPQIELIFPKEHCIFDETFKKLGEEEYKDEINNEASWKYQSRLNAYIRVNATSYQAAKVQAEEKYNQILSLLNWKFSNEFKNFFWDGQLIGKNEETEKNRGYFSSSKNMHRQETKYKSIEDSHIYLNEIKLSVISDISDIIKELRENNREYEARTLLNIINILSLTKWETEETKLLNYWIVMESLSNISKRKQESTFNFVKKVIPNMYYLGELYTPLKHLLLELDYQYNLQLRNKSNIPLSKEFAGKIGLYKLNREGSSISVSPLYHNLKNLKDCVTNEHLLDEIDATISFYSDNKIASTRLVNKREEVNLTLDYIYKTRNQIVHNGFIDKNIIPYIVSKAESYANSLLYSILTVYREGRNYDLQKHFIKELYDGELLEKRLKNKYFSFDEFFRN